MLLKFSFALPKSYRSHSQVITPDERSAMDSNVDLNSFPFKLRFSPTNKIYKDILNISSEIYTSFHKLNRELHDKNEIKNIISKLFC